MTEERLAYAEASSSSAIVQALCRDLLTGSVNLNIHADDEMLQFFLYSQGRPLEEAVALYLDSGKRIWATVRQILGWYFGSASWGGRMLDFASGYGRVTRHMVAEVPPDALWVSDVLAEGVAFQQRQFGVHGIVSTSDPELFHAEGGFDCIVVSSLFTHLPAARFAGWLRRLGSLLSSRGLLLVSVHDVALRRDEAPPASGFLFEGVSESGSLSAAEYGTCWVSEAFVRSAIGQAIGGCEVLRIPRGLGNFQDLYVVARALPPAGGFSSLRLLRTPDGFLESCSRIGKRELSLSGWVGDRVTGQPPEAVRIRIGGTLAGTCQDLRPRSSEVFAADPMLAVEWQATVAVPEAADVDAALLSIRAVSRDGEELELYSDTVLAALLRSAQLDTVSLQRDLRREAEAREALESRLRAELAQRDAQLAELGRRIGAMEASRFWKARNQWFRLKRLARLTSEP